jgi:hypothetical protein
MSTACVLPRLADKILSMTGTRSWPVSFVSKRAGATRVPRAGLGRRAGMTSIPIGEKYLRLRPATKREADVMAVKLFCLLSFIFVGLILVGVL